MSIFKMLCVFPPAVRHTREEGGSANTSVLWFLCSRPGTVASANWSLHSILTRYLEPRISEST